MWASAYFVLMHPGCADAAFSGVVLLAGAYLLHAYCTEPREQARKSAIIALLCTVSVLFWAFYFQMFLSLTLFILRIVEPSWYGLHIPPPYYVTIESLSMLIIGFFLARLTPKITLRIQEGQRAGNKFCLAILLTTLAFGLIVLLLQLSLNSGKLLSPLTIIPAYCLFALAELLLSPVGLCTITVLSSRKKVSTMMGVFFVSLGIGGFLAGKLATLTAIPHADKISLVSLKIAYLHAFYVLFAVLIGALLLTLLINQLIRQLSR